MSPARGRAVPSLSRSHGLVLGQGAVMERTEFVGADGQSWWLYEVQTEIRIEEAHRLLYEKPVKRLSES